MSDKKLLIGAAIVDLNQADSWVIVTETHHPKRKTLAVLKSADARNSRRLLREANKLLREMED